MDFDTGVKGPANRPLRRRYRLQMPVRLIQGLALAGMAVAVRRGHPVLTHPLSLLTLASCAGLGLLSREPGARRWLRVLAGACRAHRREAVLVGRLASLCREPHAPDRQARVAGLVAVLARQAGFGPGPAALLATASTLHRIGLMPADSAGCRSGGAPGNDPGAAPGPDIAARRAASIAGRLLDGESWLLASAAAMARTHQERWDGEGLPFGLSRFQIPYAGRLLQVALTLDAMIGDEPVTPVRLALLLDRIARQAGHALDPALAMQAARSLNAVWSVVAEHPFPLPGSPPDPQPGSQLGRHPEPARRARPMPAAGPASRLAALRLTGA